MFFKDFHHHVSENTKTIYLDVENNLLELFPEKTHV